jgi:hypothetical protein
MTATELHEASLETRPQIMAEIAQPPKSPFNLLDAIRRSSGKIRMEVRKRIPLDARGVFPDNDLSNEGKGKAAGLMFTSLTESISASSEEMVDAMAKTFSLFRASHDLSSLSRSSSSDEDESVNVWESSSGFRLFNSDGKYGPLTDPAGKAPKIPDPQVSQDRTPSISPTATNLSPSSDDTNFWDKNGTGCSREFSLLDTIGSRDEERDTSDTDGTLDEDETDEDSIRSQTSWFEEWNVEDGLDVIGQAIYQLASCNYKDAVNFEEDVSVASSIFSNSHDQISLFAKFGK